MIGVKTHESCSKSKTIGNTGKDGKGYCNEVFHAFTNSLTYLPPITLSSIPAQLCVTPRINSVWSSSLFFPLCSPTPRRSWILLWETSKMGCGCPATHRFGCDLQKCWVLTVLAGISWSSGSTAALKLRLHISQWIDPETKMPEMKGHRWIHLVLRDLLCANPGSDVRDKIKSANW